MTASSPLWLLVNSHSGSFSESAVKAVEDAFSANGLTVARRICFPDEDMPTASDLDAAGVGLMAVFTGDGTLNAAVTGLYGWSGQILVLPGGTMNLLCKRLHGDDAQAGDIIERVASGVAIAVRPPVARCKAGDALAGLLVGPGTSWAHVREAMRDLDIPAILKGTGEAVGETAGGIMVRCAEPERGRNDGYPLIEITPSHRGMQVDAFYADEAGEYVQQGFALLRRRFREGPHERLGLLHEAHFVSADGSALPVLVDGEPGEVESGAIFTVAACEVDLLATHHGY